MPGNEFEKQVQQKMDELKFVPSAAVWQEVEKQIKERKKRRLPFLWLLLLGVLLGGATWLYTVKNTGEPSDKQSSAGTAVADTAISGGYKNTLPPTAAITSAKQDGISLPAAVSSGKKQTKETGNTTNTGKTANEVLTTEENTNPAPVALTAKRNTVTKIYNKAALTVTAGAGQKPQSTTNEFVSKTGITKSTSRAPRYKTGNENSTVSAEKQPVAGSAAAYEENKADDTVANNHTTAPPITPAAAAGAEDTIAAVTATSTSSAGIQTKDSIGSPGQLAQNKPVAKKKKNITWGINASAGGSNISQGISQSVSGAFSGSAVFDAAFYRNNPQNNIPGSTNSGNSLNSFTRPGNLQPGMAYSLGVFISKPLRKNFSLKAGISYNYYSMGLQVGTKIDSNKALLEFSNGNTSGYTNRFHFIELPVSFEKQLGKASRFSLNAGLALSVLAGSNALQYNAQKNTYFKDNSYINKTQLGLLAGFNYRLFQKSIMVETGPQLKYGLSNIFKKEVYGNTHLFMAGIQARVYFNRNKR